MDETPAYPHIPYGQADFRRIRLRRWLYVDKTRFMRRLEQEHYAFLIRPRRFGKSLWVSLLENYYDRFWADDFGATFAGTDIGRNPTGEQSRYVTLRFNFSMVNDKLETLEREFETYCMIELRGRLRRHPDLFPEAAVRDILAPPSIAGKLSELFQYAGDHDIPLYVLIDEYDNFANTVLAYHGAEAYHSFTHGGGFFRNFFATLKGGADRSGGGLERLFITGVSPVTMDDVTSGFNIGANISLHPDFNEMVGFTEAEVRRLVGIYRGCGVFNQDVDTAMGIMGQWYNGYRFSEDAESRLSELDRLLRVPLRGGAGQGTRGHLPGAADGALSAPANRLPDRAEVPAPPRAGGRGARGGGGRRSHGRVAALPGRRAPGPAVPAGAVHRPGGGVPRLGDGIQRRGDVAQAAVEHDAADDWCSSNTYSHAGASSAFRCTAYSRPVERSPRRGVAPAVTAP